MIFHGYLDSFSVVGQNLVLSGWANEAALEIWYDGSPLAISAANVPRPDLVPVFGSEALGWGFTACAALPVYASEREKFKIKLNEGVCFDNPAIRFRVDSDKNFDAMTASFRNTVANKGGRLLEIGSRARSGSIYRRWFPDDIDYVGMDVAAGPNVDVVGDAHHMSRILSGKFDFAFSMAVFEHLMMPWKVAIEMNKVMNANGEALIISHAAWPLHEEPWDFFRFSTDSWRSLFNAHTGFEVVSAQYQYPASIVPFYAATSDFEKMSRGPTYLLSGCHVRKISECKVEWNAEVGEVYDLAYSHV